MLLFPPHFFPCSSIRPFYRLQFFKNHSSMGPFHRVQAQSFRHRLFQSRFPMCYSSCQKTSSSMGSPPQATVTSRKSSPAWAPLHETVPARSLLQCGLSMSSDTFMTHPPTAVRGPSQAAVHISAPPWSSTGCRGIMCFTMIFSTGFRGISVPAPAAPPPNHSSLTLVYAELFLFSCFFPHSSLVLQCSSLSQICFPQGITISAEGPTCALRWVLWSCLELDVSGIR